MAPQRPLSDVNAIIKCFLTFSASGFTSALSLNAFFKFKYIRNQLEFCLIYNNLQVTADPYGLTKRSDFSAWAYLAALTIFIDLVIF